LSKVPAISLSFIELLAEQFGGRDVDGAVFEQMVAKLSEHLAVFERQTRISSRIKNGGTHLIGTSGTVTTVAGVHLKLPYYSRNKVDGTWLNTADIREVSQKLLDMGYTSRVAEPCIGAERADLVLAGCAILEALLRAWPCERLRVADRGLRDGILTTLMAEDGQPDDRAVQNGARKFRHHNSRG
jgi:exopolyphosphatase/guanosine-5'-triphosphate,3'-diphosphate pyrophosphatase